MSEIEAEIDLRDRAIQLALGFAGRTISESDGTYNLLITVAQDAMREWARHRVEEEREACARIAQEKLDKVNAMPGGDPGLTYSAVMAADIRDAINKRSRGKKKNND
jgi:hypothetical protein